MIRAILAKFKRREAVKPPPCPAVGDRGYLEWVASWHPSSVVRLCAIKALGVKADREAFESRIRQIVREELDRARSTPTPGQRPPGWGSGAGRSAAVTPVN